MSVEQFTAVAMCPKCGAVDVWPFREPRREPKGDDPMAKAQRQIARTFEAMSILYDAKPLFDPDDAVVVRQCGCGHEWGQR